MNSEDLFIKIYKDHSDAIFRHCYFRVGFDRELAKDLMQETFAKTWRYIASGGEKIENPRAFLYRVATNLIINHSEKKKEVSLDKMQSNGFDPGFDSRISLENFIAGKQALATLDKIDSKYGQTIIMRYMDGLTPKEIAEILGENENVVSVRLHRGLKKLKEICGL